MRLAPALAVLLLLLGCDPDGGPGGLRVELIRASGENAARSVSGTLRVEVQQGGELLSCPDGPCETPIMGGDFELVLPIRSLTDDTLVQATVDDGREGRIGALPSFQVFGEGLETGELPARIVMEPPGTCAVLEAPPISTGGDVSLLSVPRRDMAAVQRRNLVILAGGTAAGEDAVALDRYDQIVAEMRPPLPDLSNRPGPARGVELSEDHSLIVGAQIYLVSRDPSGPPTTTPVRLHEGAGPRSAVVAFADGGGAVLGGAVGDDPSATVTWLQANGDLERTSELAQARAGAAAGALAEGVLVFGGAEGAELARRTRATPLDDPASVIPAGATGGWVAVAPDGRSALWIGFEVAGVPSASTVRVRGCPDCEVDVGPTWERARSGAAATLTEAGALWIVGGDGSADVDLVTWDGSAPSIEPRAPLAAGPRAGGAAFEQASGVITVVGGEGPDGMRGDVELCFPDALDPL